MVSDIYGRSRDEIIASWLSGKGPADLSVIINDPPLFRTYNTCCRLLRFVGEDIQGQYFNHLLTSHNFNSDESCTNCGHAFNSHDVPDWYEGETPNPSVCFVDGCRCFDAKPSVETRIDMRRAIKDY